MDAHKAFTGLPCCCPGLILNGPKVELSKCPVTLEICLFTGLSPVLSRTVSTPSPGPARASKDAAFVRTLRV